MSQLHIITVATESKYYFPYLVESCKKNNMELTVLGFGEKWKGFNWKFKLMRTYLSTLPLNDIACFIDGYDVICTRDLQFMTSAFNELKNKYNCKIITGYHCNINPFFRKVEHLFFSNSINSGTYIGTVGDTIEMLNILDRIDSGNNADDQAILNKYYNMNKNIIYIDKKNELFSTLHSYKRFELDKYYNIIDNKVFLKNTSIQPFFIHAPNANYLDNIIIKLGYDYKYKVKDIIKNTGLSSFDRLFTIYVPQILSNYYYYIAIIIIIIIILCFFYFI